MNLYDVLPLNNDKKKELGSKTANLLAESKADLDAVNRLLGKRNNYDLERLLSSSRDNYLSNFEKARVQALTETGELSKDLLTIGNDNISRLAQTPSIKISELRKLADILGFIIFPVAYLHEKATEGLGWRSGMENYIEEFKKLSKVMKVYVLAPVVYYSIQKHINSDDDDSIYAAKDITQAFMAVNMSVPVFRTMQKSLRDLRSRVDGIDSRLRTAETEIQSLSKRLDELQKQVERERAERILAEVKAQELRVKQFIQYDPMLLAMSPDSSINDNEGIAFIGPCWGPDFEDIVMTSLGLTKIPNQREMIHKIVYKVRW